MTQTRLQKLYAKRAALDAQIKRKEALAQHMARKLDTRRKVLLGALVLFRMEREPGLQASILKQLDGFLTRDSDRALFGLAPLPPAPASADPAAPQLGGDAPGA